MELRMSESYPAGGQNKEENMRLESDSGPKCTNELNPVERSKLILCLGGAFNPVHSRHIMAVVECKRWVEENLNYEVVAGKLAVAHDGYVFSKTKRTNQKCIKAEHRINLCTHACKDYSDWLQPYPKTCGSAFECGKKLKNEMFKKNYSENVKIGVIIGADRATNKSGFAKWSKDSGGERMTLCIGRKGETEQVLEQFEKDKTSGRVKTSDFHIVPVELENISSTAIRQVLDRMTDEFTRDSEKRVLLQKLVEDEFINMDCADYILSNESELYIT